MANEDTIISPEVMVEVQRVVGGRNAVADALGVAFDTVAKWRQGKRRPSPDLVRRMAVAVRAAPERLEEELATVQAELQARIAAAPALAERLDAMAAAQEREEGRPHD